MDQLELFPANESTNNEMQAGRPHHKKSHAVERRRCVSPVFAPLKRTAPALKSEAPQSEKKAVDARKQKLWECYLANPCDETRNELSLAYMPLVKLVAEGLKDKFPTHVDVNDLVSTGYIGLLDAIKKYDTTRDIKFESYSVMRIRGEILDSIRQQDIVPRQVRIKQNVYRRTLKELARTLHREPTAEEISKEMQLTAKQYQTLIESFSSGRMVSIDAGSEDKDGNTAPHIDMMPSHNEKSAGYDMQRSEVLELILKGLNKNEKQVVLGYYIEGLTMKQIGDVLELSESRVCQIHMDVLRAQRKKLWAYEDDCLFE
ncbi:MAG TPA: FliA/WhiG family RNA polymerase sigma factor [Planctomycetota bacterium]|nr:FliA/WhiG family RNA polymerase sigma factor [Planctomycetota bacterium]